MHHKSIKASPCGQVMEVNRKNGLIFDWSLRKDMSHIPKKRDIQGKKT